MDKAAMDTIIQERIERFNQFVMSQDIDKMPVGLFSGKMGICIYFYHQARLTQNKEYKKFAEKFLDSIYSQVHVEMPIDFENGLVGICYGINFLIEENFVEGNVNSILNELDDKIFRTLNFNYLIDNSNDQIQNLKLIVEISRYFCMRLKNKNLSANEQYLFQNIIIKSINKIERTSLADKFIEPPLFSLTNYFLPSYLLLLSKVYELDFYNYKIEKIFDELSDKLKSTYPLLHSNRLFLSAGIRSIENIKPINGWKEHIKLLEQDTNFTKLLQDEFRNKNIFPNDGVTGFYYITKEIHKHSKIDYNLLCEKIATSNAWNDCLKEEAILKTRIGLVTGFCGVILTYQEISNKDK